MKKRAFCVAYLFLNLTAYSASAQKSNNIWMVGNHAGINFNSNPPTTFKSTPLNGDFPQFTSSICDANGKLLLYTDGKDVWNNNNNKLEKKNNWWAWNGYTMPLLTPWPGHDSLYYLFAVSQDAQTLKAVSINATLFSDMEKFNIRQVLTILIFILL